LDALDHLIGGRAAPERTLLGSRLVRRRSCGCLSDGAPSDAPPSLSTISEPFRDAFERLRPHLARELVASARRARANLETGFEHALVEGLGEALDHVSDRRLIDRLDEVLSRTIEAGGDVVAWQTTLSELRRKLLPAVRGDAKRWMRMVAVASWADIPSLAEITSTAPARFGVADSVTCWNVKGLRNRDTDRPALCFAPPAVGSVWLVPAMPLSE
jgi:hypothetical protein